jgi:hypothetical protein
MEVLSHAFTESHTMPVIDTVIEVMVCGVMTFVLDLLFEVVSCVVKLD